MTIQETWESRLFSKYRYSPNILGLVEILSDPLQSTNDALDYILSHRSIDDADGELLDFLGEMIGVQRPPSQEPDENLLWFCTPEDYPDDLDGSQSLAPVDLSTGGYMTGHNGIVSKDDPESYVSDVEYRALIRSKATTFRKTATREVIYEYLLQFGVRCKIIESERVAEFEPHSYDILNYWVRNYIETRGLRPSGIQVSVSHQTEPDSEV